MEYRLGSLPFAEAANASPLSSSRHPCFITRFHMVVPKGSAEAFAVELLKV